MSRFSTIRAYEFKGLQLNRLIVAILFTLSGAAGLIYQVVWSRSLTLLFGSTTLAVSTVVTAFMAGLGLGSWLFGKRADRMRKALPLYAWLEVGIAVFAIMFPFLLKLLTPAFLELSRSLSGSYLLFPLGRFLLCFVALLLPTTMMGGTLPAMTRFFVKERTKFGGSVSLLYALNTFGAMIGCFTAGFFLIPSLGIDGTVALAMALNIAAALGAFFVARWETPRTETETAAHASAARASASAPTEDGVSPKLVLVLFAIAGFTSLAYEVLWTRSLLFFLGWFAVYAFTIILTTFLFGLALGSAAYPLFFRKGRNLLIAFAVIEIAIGVFGALSISVFGNLFEIIRTLEQSLPSDNWWQYIMARAGGSFAIMLIPTFLMGLAFPLASALYVRAGKGFGATIGDVYASNTIGSILGAATAGFFLLPLMGLTRSMALIAAINLVLGACILLARARGRRTGMTFALSAALVLIFAGVVNFAMSSDRPMVLQSRHFKNPNRPMELLYANEGATASLAVLRDVNSDHLELNINGESTAYTTYTDMQVHLMLSHVPLFLIDDPEKVLVIGFGLGSTSYGATLHPTVEEVHCIELVPNEVETAEYFKSVNHGVMQDPKFKLTIDDGRSYVFRTDARYDLISFNAIHPSHSPALYTVEFYEECKKKLAPGGAVCAWVPNNSFTEQQFQILLKTFVSVFPHSSMWYVNPNHLVVIGTLDELAVDWDEFVARAAQEPVRTELENYTMNDPYQLLAYHLMDENDLSIYTKGVPINSDSKPYLEYSRELRTRPEIIDAMRFHRSSIAPYLTIAPEDSAEVIDELRRYEASAYHLLEAQTIRWIEANLPDEFGRIWRTDIHLGEAFRETPDDPNLHAIGGSRPEDETRFLDALRQAPDNAVVQWNLFRLYRVRGEWDKVAETLTKIRGPETGASALARVMLSVRAGEWAEARPFANRLNQEASPVLQHVGQQFNAIIDAELARAESGLGIEGLCDLADRYWVVGMREHGEALFHEALAAAPDQAMPHFRYARALEASRRLDESLGEFQTALALPIERQDMRSFLQRSVDRIAIQISLREAPHGARTIPGARGGTIAIDPADSGFRTDMGRRLLEARQFERASIEFRLAVGIDPSNVEARLELARCYAVRGMNAEAEREFVIATELAPNRDDIRAELKLIRNTPG